MAITVLCPISNEPITQPIIYKGYIYDKRSLVAKIRAGELNEIEEKLTLDRFTQSLLDYSQTHETIKIEDENNLNNPLDDIYKCLIAQSFPREGLLCMVDGTTCGKDVYLNYIIEDNRSLTNGSNVTFTLNDFIFHPMHRHLMAAIEIAKKNGQTEINLAEVFNSFSQNNPPQPLTLEDRKSLSRASDARASDANRDPDNFSNRMALLFRRCSYVSTIISIGLAIAALFTIPFAGMATGLPILLTLTAKTFFFVALVTAISTFNLALYIVAKFIVLLSNPILFFRSAHFRQELFTAFKYYLKILFALLFPNSVLASKFIPYNQGKSQRRIYIELSIHYLLSATITAGIAYSAWLLLGSIGLSPTSLIVTLTFTTLIIWKSSLHFICHLRSLDIITLFTGNNLVEVIIKNFNKLLTVGLAILIGFSMSQLGPIIATGAALTTFIVLFSATDVPSQTVLANLINESYESIAHPDRISVAQSMQSIDPERLPTFEKLPPASSEVREQLQSLPNAVTPIPPPRVVVNNPTPGPLTTIAQNLASLVNPNLPTRAPTATRTSIPLSPEELRAHRVRFFKNKSENIPGLLARRNSNLHSESIESTTLTAETLPTLSTSTARS